MNGRFLGWLGLLASLGMLGCGDDVAASGETLMLDIPPIELENGEEITGLCYRWTLDNEEPLYVNSNHMRGTRGIHHSNWFFVPEDTYPGEDGFFDCPGFDTSGTALRGGVLFAQSTQALDETQGFEPGVVNPIPPHSQIVVDLHLLNTYGEDLETDIDLEVSTLPPSQVETELIAFAISYDALEIQPQGRTEFSLECDFNTQHVAAFGRPLDFRVHYVLPHYHALGDLLRLEVMGGPNDGQTMWETRSSIGEVLGGMPDPAVGDLTGATGIRMTCGFDNPDNDVVKWGVGDQEMCITFGFTDSERMWAGAVLDHSSSGQVGETEDGTILYEADCDVVNAIPDGVENLDDL
ncbi:MAG: hypothetical protein ACOCXM_00875 [Myxococcota bacterium]